MHAVFLVTATHLKCLQPNEKRHQVVALQNLSQLLPVFRHAISTISDNREYSTEKAEALIACSMLLLQYCWDIDSQLWSNGGSLGLYRGLVSITLSCMPRVRGGSFGGMLTWSPRLLIEKCMIYAGAKCTLDGVFAHILTCAKISNIQPEDPSDLSDVLLRLSTIFWALDPDPDEFGEVSLELAAARYLFTLPTWFSDGFIHLIRVSDGRAQVVLLYYFTAITKLRSGKFWWMTKRAIYMFNEMSRIIGDKCIECTSRALEIFSYKH
jgi:sRNA-binding regulator protein Hfq